MPPLKQVPLLFDLSTDGVGHLVEEESLRVADFVAIHFMYDEFESDIQGLEEYEFSGVARKRELYLNEQVEAFKDHILSHLPPGLTEKVLDSGVLVGLANAVMRKKRQWSPATNMAKFGLQLHAISRFAHILVTPTRKVLNLDLAPQLIRGKLYSFLSEFRDLKVLILGSGSGGWVTEAYSEKFLLGIPTMTKLVHFSLKYDCTVSILQVLSETCAPTLRILDIERSHLVQDSKDSDNIKYILACKNLASLNIFQTGLSVEGQAKIVFGLDKLVHLERGDFLSDMLEYVEEEGEAEMKTAKLNIREFWASEEYFFHTEDQMELVYKYCPDIKKMLFMFQRGSCRLSVLDTFAQLEDLELWGGAFYTDGLCDLLQMVGAKLLHLSLVHGEEIDFRALAIITNCCPNLKSLGLHNCEFFEIDTTEEQDGLPSRARIEHEARKLVTPLLDLEVIKLVSDCSSKYVELILSQCINVKEIFIGMSTGISDEVFARVLAENRLQRFEKLTIQKSKKVTMQGIELLLANCDRLRSFKYLEYCEKINEFQVKQLKARIKENNWDLILEDECGPIVHDKGNFMKSELQVAWPAVPDF